MGGDGVAQDMLQSFIRRILNTLEEIDEMQADKKAIYKEVFDAGLDRTVVAQVVGHLRKEAKDKTKFDHQSAMFDLYLSAYLGVGMVPATHAARRATVEHDAETGEVTEPQASAADQIIEGLKEALAIAKGEAEALRTHVFIEQQPAPAARDLTVPQALTGQVKPFRPNCLNRDKCGGQGPVECWQCTKAAAERQKAAQ